jgi:hypothetical protein
MTIKYSISRLLGYSAISIVFSALAIAKIDLPNWIMVIPILLLFYFDPKKLVINENGVHFFYCYYVTRKLELNKKHFNPAEYEIDIGKPSVDSYIVQISKKNYKKNLLKWFVYWVHFNANIDDLDQVYEVIDVLKKLGYTVNVPFENKRW